MEKLNISRFQILNLKNCNYVFNASQTRYFRSRQLSKKNPPIFLNKYLKNGVGLRRTKKMKNIVVRAALSGARGETPSGDNTPFNETTSGEIPTGGTRLENLFVNARSKLQDKWKELRKGFWFKVFLLLLGFFGANSLATIIGQTGDWDVLVAGFLVAAIELQGGWLYKLPSNSDKPFIKSIRLLLKFINYWKAGFMFGLFVDAFKVGS